MNTNQKKAGVATIIAGDFNTLPSIIDKTSRQKISIVPEDLKNTINQIDLTDIDRKSTQEQQKTHSFQMHVECSAN